MVGNGKCNPECKDLAITQNDGGDCDLAKRPCAESQIGNNICDSECNVRYFDWDGGDCCDAVLTDTDTNCVDPASTERAFLDVEQFKAYLRLPSDEQINIFFAHWTNQEGVAGLATFPWEKEALTDMGGILIRPDDFGVEGRMDTLVHELGHALGLWHVHRGVSEVNCGDRCFESMPSMTKGDLCEDTRPTLAHSACRDPSDYRERCGVGPFKVTPYHNYMSYADDACTNHFSKQQIARMHCYIDFVYPSWTEQEHDEFKPPAPPLAPRVVKSVNNKLTLSWLPPLNDALFLRDEGACSSCTHERAYRQYGSRAIGTASNHVEGWQPHQATGPPDSETCAPSLKSWLPDPKFCNAGTSSADISACSLRINFATPVVPYSLSIWMTWNARQGLSDVVVIFADGSTESVGPVSSSCDQKYTVVLHQIWPWLLDTENDKMAIAVILRTASAFVAIDSVELVSRPNNPQCSKCKPLRYRVARDPSFIVNHKLVSYLETDDLTFEDSSASMGTTYTYRVQAFFGNHYSHFSPALTFQLGQPFCGDKIVQDQDEQCDDGNLLNGDGCNNHCLQEAGFHCNGNPSVCFWHKGDGVCEYFEKMSVVEDCGYNTPQGFEDQWAEGVETLTDYYNSMCPISVIPGPPAVTPQMCNQHSNSSVGWRPCLNLDMLEEDPYYFEATFKRSVIVSAVVLHLAADGQSAFNNHEFNKRTTRNHEYLDDENFKSVANLDLIDEEGRLHAIGSAQLSCQANPVVVPVVHDLTKPFLMSQGVRVTFNSPDTSFAAVRLRSLKAFNPMELSRCFDESPKSLYSPNLKQCVPYTECNRPRCKEAPLVKNGVLHCTGKDEGDTCKVVCDLGHVQKTENLIDSQLKNNGFGMVTCEKSQWVGNDLSCRPVDCYLPKIPHADAVCPDGTMFGRNCTFKCRPPARMRSVGSNGGNSVGTTSVTCTKEGVWSEPESYCLLACPSPQAVDHSVIADTQCTKQRYHVYGQTCKFQCKVGYHVMGASLRRRILHLRCNSSGTWAGPSCIPVSCPEPDIKDGGLLDCTNGFRFKSTCTLHCLQAKSKRQRKDSGQDQQAQDKFQSSSSSRCEADGQWNTPFKPCFPVAESCPLPELADVSLRSDCDLRGPAFKTGTTCPLHCIQSDQEPVIRKNTTNSHGHTTSLVSVEDSQLVCTGQGVWHPNPANLFCALKCNKAFESDGFCDASNNQARCSWDKGDCCASTVKGHVVKPFPPTCQDGCKCLDPEAEENKF